MNRWDVQENYLDLVEAAPGKRGFGYVPQLPQRGAAGIDMGRNIFQPEAPVANVQAVRSIVHEGDTSDQAYQMYLDLK